MDSGGPKIPVPELMYGEGVLLVNLRGLISGTICLSIRPLLIQVIDWRRPKNGVWYSKYINPPVLNIKVIAGRPAAAIQALWI